MVRCHFRCETKCWNGLFGWLPRCVHQYEKAVSLHTDYTSPEYLAFEKKLYEKTLRGLGFGKLLPEERAPQKDLDKRKEKVEER